MAHLSGRWAGQPSPHPSRACSHAHRRRQAASARTCAIVCSLEIVLGVFAHGLIWGPKTYLRSSSLNRFEMVVVIAFWADFALWMNGITFIRFFPAIYALRPFKLFDIYSGCRVRRPRSPAGSGGRGKSGERGGAARSMQHR